MELGFRQLPHISVAVRGNGPRALIIRGSIDSDQLRRQVQPERNAFFSADVFLVNPKGRYQTAPRSGGQIMGHSDIGVQPAFDGVRTHAEGGKILLTTWLAAVPWVLAVRYDADEVFAPAIEMRHLSYWALILGGFVIVCFVLLTANTLVARLETKRQRIAMELGLGLLREISDGLANITIATQWLENHLGKAMTPEAGEDLRQIRDTATGNRERLSQFLSTFRPETSMITAVNPENVVRMLVNWLAKELHLRCIRVAWDVEHDLPEIRTDEGKLRHAIQNILLNAVDAVNQYGVIQIAIGGDGRGVAITISDSGPGIRDADRERIFEPLYTTKPEGTGLGLPVARDIIQSLGGSLILLETSAAGTVFRIFLPCELTASAVAEPEPEATGAA